MLSGTFDSGGRFVYLVVGVQAVAVRLEVGQPRSERRSCSKANERKKDVSDWEEMGSAIRGWLLGRARAYSLAIVIYRTLLPLRHRAHSRQPLPSAPGDSCLATVEHRKDDEV